MLESGEGMKVQTGAAEGVRVENVRQRVERSMRVRRAAGGVRVEKG